MSYPQQGGRGRGGGAPRGGRGRGRGGWGGQGAAGPSHSFHGTGANASSFGGGEGPPGEGSSRGSSDARGSPPRGRGGGGGRGRGQGGREGSRGRGGGGRGGGGSRRGGRSDGPVHFEDGRSGNLVCGHVDPPMPGVSLSPPAASTSGDVGGTSQPANIGCQWRTNSSNAMMLHRADRHLVYPPGGKAEVDRIDPILQDELREKARRERRAGAAGGKGKAPRRRGSDDEEEDEDEMDEDDVEQKYNSLIPGLNISLSTPELIDMWIRERKKRWPTDAVVAKKRAESWDTDATQGREAKRRKWGEAAQGEQSKTEEAATAVQKPEAVVAPTDPAQAGQAKASALQQEEEEEDSDDDDDDGPPEESSSRPPPGVVDDTKDAEASSASSSDSESDSESDSSSSSSSEEEDVAKPSSSASKTAAPPGAPVCKFWRQGRCTRGSSCRQAHGEPGSSAAPSNVLSANGPKHRPRPRQEAPNPFQAPNLLRSLLKNEIAQHVSYVCQVVRFLVRNDALKDVELRVGDAEEQRRRRGLVQVIDAEESRTEPAGDEGKLGAPLVEGGLPTLPAASTTDGASSEEKEGASTSGSTARPRGLFRPPSPLLRPLDSLAYPPEPDPMIFLDPLRAADPHPLTREEVLRIATDGPLRSLLLDEAAAASSWGETAPLHAGFRRALETLDALPTEAHRTSAVELILGVSEQSALHPHQLGATFVRPSNAMGARRVIGEKELFRLGLRCGEEEIARFKRLAQRVSELVGGVEFSAGDNLAGVDPDVLGPFGGAVGAGVGAEEEERAKRRREEARRAMWEREADRRDLLRKLGIDVD